MNKTWLITKREVKERISGKSFLTLSLVGPILVLIGIYFLFIFGGKKQQRWDVLIADPTALMDNKIMPSRDPLITYHFYNNYIEIEEFITAKKFKKYDALLEINEKILTNKVAFLFYKENPNLTTSTKIQFQFERRLEEIMIQKFTSLTISKFREVKQPINIKFKNALDPYNEEDKLAGYAGLFFGALIFFFIFLYGSSVMRSVAKDKSNRVVEVILASSRSNQFMGGKIIGIGSVALIQFLIWLTVIWIGLYLFREFLFPNIYDASKVQGLQTTKDVASQLNLGSMNSEIYNDFVSLVFERLSYFNMIFFFVIFFIGGYLFYGSLYAALGALGGSESDGQQFNSILSVLLCFALYAGYYATQNPNDSFSTFCMYLPFTSPVVAMVSLAQGSLGLFHFVFSLVILFASSFFGLWIGSRWFKNGILNFGHRLSFSHFLLWLKK